MSKEDSSKNDGPKNGPAGDDFNWGMLSHSYEGSSNNEGSSGRRNHRSSRGRGNRRGRGRGNLTQGAGSSRSQSHDYGPPNQTREQPAEKSHKDSQMSGENTKYYSENAADASVMKQAPTRGRNRHNRRGNFRPDSEPKIIPAQEFKNRTFNYRQKDQNQPNGRDNKRMEKSVADLREPTLPQSEGSRSRFKNSDADFVVDHNPRNSHMKGLLDDLHHQNNEQGPRGASFEGSNRFEGNATKGRIVDGKYVASNNEYKAQPRADFRDHNSSRTSERESWRNNDTRKDNSYGRHTRPPPSRQNRKKSPINSEQARALTEQLCEESYECMVCCERIRSSQPIWSCQNCYHLFHLKCIKLWASSGSSSLKDDTNGWRCPGCQNVTSQSPSKYTCFCGNITNPDWNPRDGITPHSCGEICKKQRSIATCSHTCNELCHPGPCPSCPVMVSKECPCGKTRSKLRCGHTKVLKCTNVCEKMLSCKQHRCSQPCHEGPCNGCEIIQVQKCHCGKDTRSQKCGEGLENITVADDGTQRYSCDKICSRNLDCGNHTCEAICHAGDCESCILLPEKVKYCPCKQTMVADLLPIGEERRSCLDPIPCCGNFCGKKLQCGPKGQSHFCKLSCHIGDCGLCDGTMLVSCRCANTETEISCQEYGPDKEFTCERRCNKKRKCGRHRCNQKCCMDMEHNCNLICGRKLGCGLHKCDELCHTGNCPRCWQTSFDERLCYCGETVQYPPIPCGAPLLTCQNLCTRPHPCNHPPQHNCHNEEVCPPCVVLVEKRCLCKQEIRKNFPCHINIVSCGKPCGKDLPCGQHKCPKICHKDRCLDEGENCQQPCTISRRDCPHPCNSPCHFGQECQEGICKSQITIRCKCGRKSEKVLCLAGNSKVQFQRFATDSMGDKLRNLRSGQSVDISELMIAEKRGGLECDEECTIIERNKRLAEALGIENPEGNHFQSSLPFSFFLKEEAKKQLPLVKMVEDAIDGLIHKINKSSLVQISHSFPPMNSTQRKLIHELAGHYNCKTVSYDQEPIRNTVVTASRESLLVSTKLSAIVERKTSKPLPNPMLPVQDRPLTFQRMQKKNSQDDLTATAKTASVDYFGDDFVE